MRSWRLLGRSLQTLAGHRGRSLLCVLAVAVGIAAVFVTSALSGGAQDQLLRAMASLGADLLVVRPAEARKLASRKAVQGQVTTLRLEDAAAILQLEDVADAAPAIEGMANVRSDTDAMTAKVIGTTNGFLRIRRFGLERGRFFDDEEARRSRRVAVIGARVEHALFGGQDPVGQTLRIKGVPFEIVGTLQPKGASDDGADSDLYVVVPVSTAQRRVFNVQHLNVIFVGARDARLLSQGEERIRTLLRTRHGLQRKDLPDDFAVQNQQKLLHAQRKTAQTLTLASSALAAVALMIGGAGILALMLLSVRERTPEIGLRVALGATQRAIFLEFLAEAMVLSTAGGVLGVGVGLLGARALSIATGWPTRVATDTALSSMAVAITLGFVFGVLPCRRAARLPPVEALAEE
ncbi:MAG: ABC transporter permease [Deltaproteobacteria bacterium]|nr:ABC transporter permease [Deltaproteobacteria bacterium]